MPSLNRASKVQDKPEARPAPKSEDLTGSRPKVRLAVELPPPASQIPQDVELRGRVPGIQGYDKSTPIRAFHGTDASFEQFDTSEVNTLERKRLGAYFTENKRYAECYGSNILEVNLTLNNPFDITERSAIEVIGILPIPDRLKQELRSGFRGCDGAHYGLLETATRGGLRAALESRGYDSIKFTEGCGNAYIAFYPEQIERVKPIHFTETPEFKAWFGTSMAVDGNSVPLTLYHGSPTPGIRIFDKLKQAGGQGGKGFYFVMDQNSAESYIKLQNMRNGTQGGEVYAVHLKLENPYIIERRDIPMNGISQKVLQHHGYDGVVITDCETPSEFIAFTPEQIKSATDNCGAFDPTNPSIHD